MAAHTCAGLRWRAVSWVLNRKDLKQAAHSPFLPNLYVISFSIFVFLACILTI